MRRTQSWRREADRARCDGCGLSTDNENVCVCDKEEAIERLQVENKKLLAKVERMQVALEEISDMLECTEPCEPYEVKCACGLGMQRYDRDRVEAEMVDAGFTEDDSPHVPRCQQCEGPAHICELPDSTCRFKELARETYPDTTDGQLRRLARLFRGVEDGAWERLSVARTKQLHRLKNAVRVFARGAKMPPNEDWKSCGCDGEGELHVYDG